MDVVALLTQWRAGAHAGPVAREVLEPDGRFLNYHARVIERPLSEAYQRVARMGTGLDDVWPLPSIPMKIDGELRPGVAAAHGHIRYELVATEENERIEWRFTMDLMRGRHEYLVARDGDRTIVEHVIDGQTSGDLTDLWPAAVGPLHDWIIERIFDRLAQPPAPWFDLRKAALIR